MPEDLYRRGPFSIEVEEKGGLAVARLSGEFSGADSAPLIETLTRLVSAHEGVLVDLRGVKYIPSKMISPLVQAAPRRAREDAAGAKFFAILTQAGSQEKIFKMVGVDKAVRLFTDEESAHAAFLAPED